MLASAASPDCGGSRPTAPSLDRARDRVGGVWRERGGEVADPGGEDRHARALELDVVVGGIAGRVGERPAEAVGLAEPEVHRGERREQVDMELSKRAGAGGLGGCLQLGREALRVRDRQAGAADRPAQLGDPGLELEQPDLLPVRGAELRQVREIAGLDRRSHRGGVRTVNLGHLPAEPERRPDHRIRLALGRAPGVVQRRRRERAERVGRRAGAHGCPPGSPA